MGRFVEGEDRRQSFLLPQTLDDYVTEDNPVRVVDVFIDALDLAALGFEGVRQVDASIAPYLTALDRADREDSDIAEAKTPRIKDKIAGLRRQMQDLKAMEQQVQDAPDKQVSRTDPDARSMAASGRGTGMVGYNVQAAVDAQHHLIVAHEVTNQGHDRTQLHPIALKAQAATGCEALTALADRGYFNGEQLLACEGTGVLPCIPKSVWPSERLAQ
jgi:hypothetical protein